MADYWNHNVAYHPWILKHIPPGSRVLDVGCGEGLLAQKLAQTAGSVVGVEPHGPSARAARERLAQTKNAIILETDFESVSAPAGSFDVILFEASIHHMPLESSIVKAKNLLAKNGRLLLVGCARPQGLADYIIEALRVIPAKIGSLLHGERNGGRIGVPTQAPDTTLKEIRHTAARLLPGARIRLGLYYRYLLVWDKT